MTTSNKETPGEKPITITIHGSEEMPLKLRQAIAEMVDAVLLWNKATRPVHQDAPTPTIARDKSEDAWLIEIRSGNNKGILQVFDSGEIVALVTDGNLIRSVDLEPAVHQDAGEQGEEANTLRKAIREAVDLLTSLLPDDETSDPATKSDITNIGSIAVGLLSAALSKSFSPPATAETEEIATEIAEFARNHSGNWNLLRDFISESLARHSAANDARIAELEAEIKDGWMESNHAGTQIIANLRALLNAAETEIAEQQMKITELKEDVNHLNQMLRDKGYGQGEIDAYASQCDQCDELAALKEAKDEAFRNLREAHIIRKQLDDREIAELKEENLAGLKMQQESDKLLDAALNKGRVIESELADLKESIASLSHPNCKMLLGDIAARDNKIAELKELLAESHRRMGNTAWPSLASRIAAALTKQQEKP